MHNTPWEDHIDPECLKLKKSCLMKLIELAIKHVGVRINIRGPERAVGLTWAISNQGDKHHGSAELFIAELDHDVFKEMSAEDAIAIAHELGHYIDFFNLACPQLRQRTRNHRLFELANAWCCPCMLLLGSGGRTVVEILQAAERTAWDNAEALLTELGIIQDPSIQKAFATIKEAALQSYSRERLLGLITFDSKYVSIESLKEHGYDVQPGDVPHNVAQRLRQDWWRWVAENER